MDMRLKTLKRRYKLYKLGMSEDKEISNIISKFSGLKTYKIMGNREILHYSSGNDDTVIFSMNKTKAVPYVVIYNIDKYRISSSMDDVMGMFIEFIVSEIYGFFIGQCICSPFEFSLQKGTYSLILYDNKVVG